MKWQLSMLDRFSVHGVSIKHIIVFVAAFSSECIWLGTICTKYLILTSIVQLKVPLVLKGVKTAAVANVWSYDTNYILLTGKMAFKIFRQKLGIRDNQIRNIRVFKKLVISRKTYLGVYEISPVQDTDIYL